MHLRRSTQTLINWCAISRINEMFDINSQPKKNRVVLVADTDHQSIHAMADIEGSQNFEMCWVGIYFFAVDTNYSVAVKIVLGLVAVGHFDVARMNKVFVWSL
ncbi:hypothetical protein OUZ56_026270 [Daphnia magna]|uniref:Uncharacterized protein n=1 Tax=Daphnia magna TaxID=35525 RepID=A0ABQ9ZLQ6_9CRUS|nr:hypothetical protein OUZ56_026270 [Daphnia magna]